uniref:Bowman-Birk serine protease inhibitors family domain-containing protein n=1 Tax=Setaria viridis TaxID=4556 RepID=A0A4U6U123_SETVI|nr:hypothetical protein SEVIR_7G276800v2 [Setaria viridis]
MRGCNTGSLLFAMTILFVVFLGCLAVPAQSARRSYPSNLLANTTTNASEGKSTSSEDKFVLIFCIITDNCDPNGNCNCCENQRPNQPKCFRTLEQCQANCPACNPHCPPHLKQSQEPNW